MPHRVVPGGNLAVLKKKKNSAGDLATQTKKVGVVLKAKQLTRGACRPGSSTDTFSLTLSMVDDEGHPIELEGGGIRTGLTCDRRIGQQKFMATYRAENCAGGAAPVDRSSKGKVTIVATTDDGPPLEVIRTLKCNKPARSAEQHPNRRGNGKPKNPKNN